MKFLQESKKMVLNDSSYPGKGARQVSERWSDRENPSDQDLRLGALVTILFFIGVALGLFFELII